MGSSMLWQAPMFGCLLEGLPLCNNSLPLLLCSWLQAEPTPSCLPPRSQASHLWEAEVGNLQPTTSLQGPFRAWKVRVPQRNLTINEQSGDSGSGQRGTSCRSLKVPRFLFSFPLRHPFQNDAPTRLDMLPGTSGPPAWVIKISTTSFLGTIGSGTSRPSRNRWSCSEEPRLTCASASRARVSRCQGGRALGVCLTNADPGLLSNLPLMDTSPFPHRGGHALSICTLESWRRQGAPWVPLTTRRPAGSSSAAACTSSAPSA